MKKVYSLLLASLLFVSVSHAASKLWNGGTGGGKNWTSPGNWTPVGAPAAGDDITFNTVGTITFSTLPASVAYNSITISAGSVVLAGSNMTFTIGGAAGTDFTIALGATLTMTNASITLANSATADISGSLLVGTGRTFNTNGTSVVSTVTGSISNTGTVTCTTAAKLLMQSGSVYTHSQNGGNVPTATWNSSSTCNITGITGTDPTNVTQTFGNLTWNCAGQTGNSFPATVNITGNLTIANTNGQEARPNDGATHTIGGDYIQTGGIIRWTRNTAGIVNVTGDVAISGGECRLSTGNQQGTLNLGGDFSITGSGIITETGTGSGIIFFANGTHTYTSGGTVSNTINFVVNSVNMY